uniref:C-type lectin domain-containing protein n=1 Tax=Salarias fasciatus TaxID=181472 RepID=A0A672HX46_SALFA
MMHLKGDELKRRLDDLFLQSIKENHNERLHEGRWVPFRSSLYYISSTERTWQESRDDCLSRGADLMIIDSQEEQDFSRRFSQEVWIGLTDSAQEGTWQWVDGTLLNTSYWLPGEPNNDDEGKEENCAEIHVDNGWNDRVCEKLNYWICEKMAEN